MPEITIYTTSWCSYCRAAKRLLDRNELLYEEINLDGDPSFRQRVMDLTGRHTVPQVIVDGQSIGGFEELERLVAQGELRTDQAATADSDC